LASVKILEVEGIHTYYDLSHVLFDVSISISKGEIVGLLGRNGAGKSTTIKSIMGLTPPKEGKIILNGKDITRKKPFAIVKEGLSFVPDDRRVFADLKVEDNLEIPFKREGYWNKQRIYEFFPQLKDIEDRRAGYLSGGEQQMLAIGRALINNADLLLLDEPMEGLAPLLVRELEKQVLKLKEMGLSILLAEQNINSVLRLVDRVYVIDNGRIKFEGTPKDLEKNEEIKRKYLGV
jgi:branched-chain amino acid transport system ATP-binding protein